MSDDPVRQGKTPSRRTEFGYFTPVDPYYDLIAEIYDLDPDIALKAGFIARFRLLSEGHDCRPYLDAVISLAEGSKFGGRVRVESKLASLLDLENAHLIKKSFESEVFRSYLDEGKLPPFSWGGKEMLHALRTGERRENYDNDIKMAKELGRKDVQDKLSGYTHSYPDCYVDLGSGDGRKGVARTIPVLKAGHDVIYIPLDNSMDAVRESIEHAKEAFSGIVGGKGKKPWFDVRGMKVTIEDLSRDDKLQSVVQEYPNTVWLFYGTTAANYDPTQSVDILDSVMPVGGYAEVGLQLYSGDDEGILNAFRSDVAMAVSSVGLRALGFSDSQIGSMRYGAEIVKRDYEEFRHFGIGTLPVVKTFFIATKPTSAGLVYLRTGDCLPATQRCMYTDNQFRKVYTQNGRFRISDKRQIGHDAIYSMVKL